MSSVPVLIVLFLGFAVLMEGVAWLTHKYVMHEGLWSLHEDHHRPRRRGFQKNDLFTLFFSSIAFLVFLAGSLTGEAAFYAAGAGITAYGLGYFLFHDVMFHKRLKFLKLRPGTRYLRRIVKAHAVHHQTARGREAVSFGFLYAPRSYGQDPDESGGKPGATAGRPRP